MSSSTNAVSSNGIGFGSLLGITFIILKLCHVIAWSWLWVLSPLWIPLVLFLGIFAIAFIVGIIVAIFNLKRK